MSSTVDSGLKPLDSALAFISWLRSKGRYISCTRATATRTLVLTMPIVSLSIIEVSDGDLRFASKHGVQ